MGSQCRDPYIFQNRNEPVASQFDIIGQTLI